MYVLEGQVFDHYRGKGGGKVICQQKLPAAPGICPIFSNARGLLAAGIDSHIIWYLDFKEFVK